MDAVQLSQAFSPESNAPVLERIAGSGPRPIFVSTGQPAAEILIMPRDMQVQTSRFIQVLQRQ